MIYDTPLYSYQYVTSFWKLERITIWALKSILGHNYFIELYLGKWYRKLPAIL